MKAVTRGERLGHSHRTATAMMAVLVAMFGSVVEAQDFGLDWWTVDGGGEMSTGGVYTITGTIGQPDAGNMRGANFALDGGFWGLIVAIQTPEAPALSIINVGGTVTISWPLTAEGFVLEQTNRLTGVAGPWSTVPTPYMTNGQTISIQVSPVIGNWFYRLRKD